jgi:hypothetical protein
LRYLAEEKFVVCLYGVGDTEGVGSKVLEQELDLLAALEWDLNW